MLLEREREREYSNNGEHKENHKSLVSPLSLRFVHLVVSFHAFNGFALIFCDVAVTT